MRVSGASIRLTAGRERPRVVVGSYRPTILWTASARSEGLIAGPDVVWLLFRHGDLKAFLGVIR
jgi:hypothetical protein